MSKANHEGLSCWVRFGTSTPRPGDDRVRRLYTLVWVSLQGSVFPLTRALGNLHLEPACAMRVDVHLPSGDGFSVEVSPETPISELKVAAQQHFQRRLKLTAKAVQLDLRATVKEAGLGDGDVVAAVVQLGQLSATYQAFALHGLGAELETWGDPGCGADSGQVQEQLRNIQCIQATAGAFAAILESGAVVTWGDAECGGDSGQVQEQLRNIQCI